MLFDGFRPPDDLVDVGYKSVFVGNELANVTEETAKTVRKGCAYARRAARYLVGLK